MKRINYLFLAIIGGVLLSLGWPAIGDMPLLLFTGFVPLLFIEDSISRNNQKGTSLFWLSYLCFLTWNVLTTWWIYCVSGNFATKLISAGSAILINPIFMAIIFHLFHVTRKRAGTKEGYISLIVYWLSFEYIHLNWDLSYPWMTLGNGFANATKWVQWYEFTGVAGGSLWVLLINLFIFLILKKLFTGEKRKPVYRLISVAAIVLIVPMLLSYYLYHNYREAGNPVRVVIVQPNVDPYHEKYNGLSPEEQLVRMLNLAGEVSDDQTEYILGPETAIPRPLWEDELATSASVNILRAFIEKFPKVNVVLGLSSSKVYEPGEAIPATARKMINEDLWYDYFNSAMQVDGSGAIQVYHKSKLVLGVEKMPFPAVFRHFQELAFDLGGTTGSLGTQDKRSVFTAASSISIAPVICWESVYGEFVGEYVSSGAQLIFILTNDGWWEDTPGYRQHMAYSRLRTIETRRSIARSANTGVSCFINQRGDVFQPTEWWKETAIKMDINANDEITFYTRFGDYIFRIAMFVSLLLLLWTIVKKLSKKELSLK